MTWFRCISGLFSLLHACLQLLCSICRSPCMAGSWFKVDMCTTCASQGATHPVQAVNTCPEAMGSDDDQGAESNKEFLIKAMKQKIAVKVIARPLNAHAHNCHASIPFAHHHSVCQILTDTHLNSDNKWCTIQQLTSWEHRPALLRLHALEMNLSTQFETHIPGPFSTSLCTAFQQPSDVCASVIAGIIPDNACMHHRTAALSLSPLLQNSPWW